MGLSIVPLDQRRFVSLPPHSAIYVRVTYIHPVTNPLSISQTLPSAFPLEAVQLQFRLA